MSMKVPFSVMVDPDVTKGITAVDPKGKLETPSLVELRNGKIVFKQKSLSFEKLSATLQEIVEFRQMLESRVERQDPPLTTIPDEHKPVIAKLAHESDKKIGALAKHIRHELLPTQDEDASISAAFMSALPLEVVDVAINSVMDRNNYGLDGITGGGKVPAAMCVWRWEVKEQYIDWLPKNLREKTEARMAERIQAKKDLKLLFESLSQETRDTIVDAKGGSKLSSTERHKNNPASVIDLVGEADGSSKKQSDKQQQEKAENEENNNKLEGCSGRQRNPEKASKDKEKQEKKLAKEKREKKAKEAELKSRSLLANFFGKGKTVDRAPPLESVTTMAEPSSSVSDFEKTFKSFVLKKDTDLAPINWFVSAKMKGPVYEKDVISVDDERDVKTVDIEMQDIQQVDVDVSGMDARERLNSIMSSFPPSADPFITSPLSTRSSSVKNYTYLTVRDIFGRLTEAEITGDVSLVRALLSKLRDRKLIPAKVLIFADDERPGYFGTWTRFSDIIGPRTPFAKDSVLLDYSYDSGEEWEAEGTGEADDVVEDEEDDDVDAEDADSDLESWLDDDVTQDDRTPLGSRPTSPSIPPPVPAQKRKSDNGDQKLGKKRKVIVPLAPFAKGPCWESTIGRCEYDLFKSYKIHLFNDTPWPVDPFTFVNTSQERRSCANDPPTLDAVFAVPPLPERLIVSKSTSASAPGPVQAPSKRGPKTSFPDAHLPLLLTKISSLATGNIVFLVESIYQELHGQKVKKNAIEAKVKEVGERCREKKIWVVKSEVVP